MQPQQTPKPVPVPLSLGRSLLAVPVVAALAGVCFWLIVDRLIGNALEHQLHGKDFFDFLSAVFLVTIMLPVIIGVSLTMSTLLAWLAMRLLHIAKAGLIALCSIVTLGVMSWLYFYHAAPHLSWSVALPVAAFALVFETWAAIFLMAKSRQQ